MFFREGGNQDASTLRKDLTGWVFVGVIVGIALTIGSIAMTGAPPDFILAKWCFPIAGALLCLKIADYLATKQLRRGYRMLMAFIGFGLVGLGITEYWNYINRRQIMWEAGNKPPARQKEVIIGISESLKTIDSASPSRPVTTQMPMPSPTPMLVSQPTPALSVSELADEIAKRLHGTSPQLYIIRSKAVDLADEIIRFAKDRDDLIVIDTHPSGAQMKRGKIYKTELTI